METLLGLALVVLVIWLIAKRRKKKQELQPANLAGKAVALDLPTREYFVVGMENYLNAREAKTINPPFLVAIPEPNNHHDRNAVMIADPSGRKIGYMSAGLAEHYQKPILKFGALRLGCRKVPDGLRYQIPKWQDLETHTFWKDQ